MSTPALAQPSSADTLPAIYGAVEGAAPLRWGILGTGTIAEDFANALSPCRDVKLQAIGSRSEESAKKFAKLFGIPNAHGSFEALVNDASVDVIYVATPDAHHTAHALLALRAGKHVLVEKPFADSAAAAETVFAESARRGLFVMEAMWTRWVPAVEDALRQIAEGRIGRVAHVYSDFGCQYAIPAGALNALGVYSIALSQLVYGADQQRQKRLDAAAAPADADGLQSTPIEPLVPAKIHALGSLNEAGTADSQVTLSLQYGPGQLSTCTASLLVNAHNEALIVGTEGRIRLLGPMWHSCTRYTIVQAGSDGEEQVVSFDSNRELPLVDYPRPFNLLNSQRLVYEAVEVNRCVRAKLQQSSAWSHAQTMQVMRIMDEVRKQIRQ